MGDRRYFYSFAIATSIYILFIFGVYNLNINKDIKQKRQTVVKLSIFKPEPLVKKEIPKKLNIPAPVPVIKKPKVKRERHLRKKRKSKRRVKRRLKRKRLKKKYKKRRLVKKSKGAVKSKRVSRKKSTTHSYRRKRETISKQQTFTPAPISEIDYSRYESHQIEQRYEARSVAPIVENKTHRAISKQVVAKQSRRVKRKSLDGRKRAFLSSIRDIINSNKSYPRRAKRMGIEGSVRVTFNIDSFGNVSNIRVSNAPTILKKAVMKAIRKSFPVNIPKDLKSIFPIRDISVNIFFKLD